MTHFINFANKTCTSLVCISLFSISLLSACASSNSGNVYTREQTRNEMTVRFGVVEAVRPVQIEGTKSPVGAVAGAVVGGIGGSNVGKGSGEIVGAVLGAVAGGLAGSAIEEAATRKTGMEITVKLDNGQVTAIVQEGDETFQVGERVRLLSGAGGTRVSH